MWNTEQVHMCNVKLMRGNGTIKKYIYIRVWRKHKMRHLSEFHSIRCKDSKCSAWPERSNNYNCARLCVNLLSRSWIQIKIMGSPHWWGEEPTHVSYVSPAFIILKFTVVAVFLLLKIRINDKNTHMWSQVNFIHFFHIQTHSTTIVEQRKAIQAH